MVISALLFSSFLSFATPPVCASAAIRAAFLPRVAPVKTCNDLPATEQDLCREGADFFSNTNLSADNRVACANCHQTTAENPTGALNDKKSRPYLRGRDLDLPRTPSLLDVARTRGPFFWNGRAQSLATQPFWPLYGEHELRATPQSLEKFGGAHHVAEALSIFMKTFETNRAPFDEWLTGSCAALDEHEAIGARLVLQEKTCASCHQGTELRGTLRSSIEYRNMPSYARAKGEVSYSADAELAIESGDGTRTVLQTVAPSLRNLRRKGGPYGRFGQHQTLRDYLHQHGSQPTNALLRFNLTDDEEEKILNFLTRGLASQP